QRLLETEAERVRDADDLQDVVVAEARVPRPYGRLRDSEPPGDRPERLAPVLLERLDDALVDLVDPARSAYRPAPLGDLRDLSVDPAQCEAIRTTPPRIASIERAFRLAMRSRRV